MPVYEYEHTGDVCKQGKRFELEQSIRDDHLKVCPTCGKPIRRLLSVPNISTPTGDTDLKSKGFTKLVRRDKGVYENVTALENESRVFEAGKPETMPDLRRKIQD